MTGQTQGKNGWVTDFWYNNCHDCSTIEFSLHIAAAGDLTKKGYRYMVQPRRRRGQAAAPEEQDDVKHGLRCVCADTRCQRDTSTAGSGVRMPQDRAELLRWYKKLRSSQLSAEQLESLAEKAESHRVAKEHFKQDGLYDLGTGELHKTSLAFPSRPPVPLPAKWKWATRKHPNQPPNRYEEQKALEAAGSDILRMVVEERNRLRRQNKVLLKQRSAAEEKAKALAGQLKALEQGSPQMNNDQQRVVHEIEAACRDRPLSWDAFENSDFLQSKIPEWTGFRNWTVLKKHFDMLNWDGVAERLILWNEKTGYGTIIDEGDQEQPRKRCRHSRPALHSIDARSAYLFTWTFLKAVDNVGAAGGLYGLDNVTSTRYLVTWLRFMSDRLEQTFPFPSKGRILETLPDEYKQAYSCMLAIVLDCTDITTARPSDPSVAKSMYSTYYSHYGGKILGGLFPCGALAPVPSTVYPIAITDPVIVAETGVVDQLFEDADVASDKAFLIKRLLNEHNMDVIHPPLKREGMAQFPPQDSAEGHRQSNHHIHEPIDKEVFLHR